MAAQRRHNPLEALLEFMIFNSHWLLVPFYLGLVAVIVVIGIVFGACVTIM